jgi:hypothetical protein
MNAHCLFSDPAVVTNTVIFINHAILSQLWHHERLRGAMMQVLKTTVPNDVCSHLIRSRSDAAQVKRLLTVMRESKTFQLSRKVAEKPEKKPGNPEKAKPEKPAPKRGGKAKKAAKAKAKPEAPEALEDMNDDGTETTFLDDVGNAIDYTLRAVEPHDKQDSAITQVWCWAIEFGLKGSVDVPASLLEAAASSENSSINFKAWSKLRRHLKKLLIETHPTAVVAGDDVDAEDPDLRNDDASQIAEGDGRSGNSDGLPKDASEQQQQAFAKLKTYIEADPKFISKLAVHCKDNTAQGSVEALKRLHPALSSSISKLWAVRSETSQTHQELVCFGVASGASARHPWKKLTRTSRFLFTQPIAFM